MLHGQICSSGSARQFREFFIARGDHLVLMEGVLLLGVMSSQGELSVRLCCFYSSDGWLETGWHLCGGLE